MAETEQEKGAFSGAGPELLAREELMEAFVSRSGRSDSWRERPARISRETEPCPPLPNCPTIATDKHASYSIPFRASIRLDEKAPPVEPPTLGPAVIPKDSIRIEGFADLMIDQRWRLRRVVRGDLASVMSLAPGEIVRMHTSQSLRKSFTQNTLDQSTELNSTESTVIDKDVLEVTRASSKTQNWGVDAHASIPIKGVELSAGANIGEQLQRTASSVLTDLHESTSRSASQVTLLNKVEITTVTEQSTTEQGGRLVANPYRDRVLDIMAFQLEKEYDVNESVVAVCPAYVVTINEFTFDETFLRANGAFIEQEFLDSTLAYQLAASLADAPEIDNMSSLERAGNICRLAFEYLFEVGNVFNVPDIQAGSGTIGGTGRNDANAPKTSFDALYHSTLAAHSGLLDSLASEFGIQFTILNYYWALFRDSKVDVKSDQEIVDMALSLYEAIGSRWLQLMDSTDPNKVQDVLDMKDLTEIFRRLGGFAALIGGVARRLGKPSVEEAQIFAARKRAETAIGRAKEHMKAYKKYYIERFLAYTHSISNGSTTVVFAEAILEHLRQHGQDVVGAISRNAYVDGDQIRIPAGDCMTPESFLRSLSREVEIDPQSWGGSYTVAVAANGVHFHAVAGDCSLRDVPAEFHDRRVVEGRFP